MCSRINAAIKDPHIKLASTSDGDTPITVKWTKVRQPFLKTAYIFFSTKIKEKAAYNCIGSCVLGWVNFQKVVI